MNSSNKKLTEEQKAQADQEITIQEIANAVMQMPNNKAPGLDGLSIEMYKFFWSKIKEHYFQAILYAKTEKGILDKNARRGVITLIPKKQKDLSLVENWRPLTMLNCDYKILAKTMALRMQPLLPNLIH